MMKREVFEIFNGDVFRTQKDAERKLDQLYGEVITGMARRLVEADGKYAKTLEVLEGLLPEMGVLLRIKADGYADEEEN